jgi:hypothetical protein
MNGKRFILPILALCLVVNFSGLCSGKDQKATLTVNKIIFTSDMIGGEWITLFCNQSCTPELFTLEGENPRVIMDMKGVSLIQSKTRNVNTGGKLVKSIRSYLDKQTHILRVVLDLKPSKSYIVRPRHDQPKNAYVLMIYEDTSLSEQKPGGSWDAKGSLPSQEKGITILRPDQRPGEKKGNLPEAAPSPENRSVEETIDDVPSVDQGQSQMNNGDFAAAVDTFTQILATNPQDSLIYRLRGDAYDNLGDEQKAMEDWTKAARLGDTVIQSSLDSQGVKWRETPTP